ncbi:hypothetical protein D3273_05380 [Lichenibacterium minor]|uniref:DUF4148 domain-containing protein n=1 Tax=Lichenibacterium minor TaxID=2316528 RepID=A0A4Q2UCK1_9HYPH|nr:hypothetical protein [Lichenibacterium minor]RYC32897.1 hypothetical protein D3273_05380 [Lichenibacterium minor]
MLGKEPDRKSSSGRWLAALALAAVLAAPPPVRAAEGLWDSVLEKMNIKAAPPGPGPDFVERTRPDAADLGYLPTATPHRVSPLPVKTPGQIEAQKSALDAAQQRQLHPGAPKPLGIGKGKRAAKPVPEPAVAD